MGNDGKERNDLKRKLGYRQVAHKKVKQDFVFKNIAAIPGANTFGTSLFWFS